MRRARILKQRFASLFRRQRAEAHLDRELSLHVEQLTKENIACGMSESEARLQARREFGSFALVQEACRDMRLLRSWEASGSLSDQRVVCVHDVELPVPGIDLDRGSLA